MRKTFGEHRFSLVKKMDKPSVPVVVLIIECGQIRLAWARQRTQNDQNFLSLAKQAVLNSIVMIVWLLASSNEPPPNIPPRDSAVTVLP